MFGLGLCSGSGPCLDLTPHHQPQGVTLRICIIDKAKGARPYKIPTKFDEEGIAVNDTCH